MTLPSPSKADRFEAFCWRYLAHYLKHPIEDFHRELISLVEEQRVAIAAPRSFAKSTYFSLFYPLFMALRRPGIKILLISATSDWADGWIAKISKELENNEGLIADYSEQAPKGRDKEGKWTSSELHLKNGSVIYGKGAGKQIRGLHPNIVIGDDLETDEMVISKDRRDKFDHWFWTDIIGTLVESDEPQLIVVGTLLHPESFLAELVHNGRHGWTTKFYAAIKEDGNPLWPDQWSLEDLDNRKREMGQYAFDQEYMNNPLPDDLRKFQKQWIQYFDKEPPGCTYFTTVDPAIEVGNPNDCTAIVTCAVDRDENMYVVDVINKKILPKETIDLIFDVYRRYDSAVIGIEEMGFMKLLKYEIESQRRKRGVYPVIRGLKSEGRRKELRIERLQPRFEHGTIYIRKSDKELETQLLRFPSPRCHDDIIDALAYQLDILRPAKHEVKRINPNSFAAELARRKNKTGTGGSWGNLKLREW